MLRVFSDTARYVDQVRRVCVLRGWGWDMEVTLS